MHRLAELVLDRGEAEQSAERGLAVAHHRREGQQRVEPVAELARKALGDEVRRVPLAPVVAVGRELQRAERDDPGVEPGVADIGDAAHAVAGARVDQHELVDPRPVRGVPDELVPALDGTRLQLLHRADHVELRRVFLVHPDGQRQAPVALLRDHPVAHVAQPVALAGLAVDALREERDLVGDLHDVAAEAGLGQPLAHVQKPLVHEPVDQLGLAAPAVRVAVDVALDGEQPVALFQLLEDDVGGRGVGGEVPRERAEAVREAAVVAQRRDRRQAVLLAPGEVDAAAAGGRVDDAGALPFGHVVAAADDPVRVLGADRRAPAVLPDDLRHFLGEAVGRVRGRDVVERAVVGPAQHLLALDLADDFDRLLAGLRLEHLLQTDEVGHLLEPVALALRRPGVLVGVGRTRGHAVLFEDPLGDVVDLALEPHFEVRQFRVDRRADVAGERPRRRRPGQQTLAGAVAQGELDEGGAVLDELVPLLHLHLGEADAAPAAPRHHVVAAVDHLAVVALLEETPDRRVVRLGHGEVRLPLVRRLGPVGVGAVPVHPVAQADRLLGLHPREPVDPGDARLDEEIDGRLGVARDEVFDVAFRLQAEFLFDLDLDPQPLAVEALLVAEFAAGHREEAVVGVLVGAIPGVVDAHRVVGRDRAVEERPRRLAGVQRLALLEDAAGVPEGEHVALQLGEIDLTRLDLLERHRLDLARQGWTSRVIKRKAPGQ